MRPLATQAAAPADEAELAQFASGLRRRYSDDEILAELKACAERIGRSPTMREFVRDRRTRVHPQTVIEHFGTWNAAKRQVGLAPRRFATREELLDHLRALGKELGRIPTTRDLRERRAAMPSKSLYWHTFGSLSNALREQAAAHGVLKARPRAPLGAEEAIHLPLGEEVRVAAARLRPVGEARQAP